MDIYGKDGQIVNKPTEEEFRASVVAALDRSPDGVKEQFVDLAWVCINTVYLLDNLADLVKRVAEISHTHQSPEEAPK